MQASPKLRFALSNQLALSPLSAMPVNKLGGNKAKRSKAGCEQEAKRDLVFKEDGQEYGKVLRMLGNGRCEVSCFDGTQRQGHIRGQMRKRVWVSQGDIVLVALRDFQDEKADIILRYTPEEARNLIHYKELPAGVKLSESLALGGDASGDEVVFGDDAHIDLASI